MMFATGMENALIYIKADNAENELERFLTKVATQSADYLFSYLFYIHNSFPTKEGKISQSTLDSIVK